MKFKRHIELEHGLKQIDIAPLIDIVFLLLIFFMLTSSFLSQPGIKVNLPRAATAEAMGHENVEILVTADNIVYLNGRAANIQDIDNFLKEVAKRGPTVFIKADKRASLGIVAQIWDMARSRGVSAVNIATNQ